MTFLSIMLLPFLECLILVGIHSYLGLHVIRRQIIFIDLTLAQLAAMGTSIAFIFGFEPFQFRTFLISFLAALLGGIIFSFTRQKEKEGVPQEGIIGLGFAISASLSVLILDKFATGTEHMKDIFMGNILWVRKEEFFKAFIIYSIIGFIFAIFHKKFLLVSENIEEAKKEGLSIFFWDVLFYGLFALVITTSVEVAGVFLVFTFLITPALMAVQGTKSFLFQLLIGWSAGIFASLFGLIVSYLFDLPSGPSVVVIYGIILVLWSFFIKFFKKKNGRGVKSSPF